MEDNREIAITISDLSIVYRTVQAYSIKKNLLKLKKADTDSFTAVKHVSFDIPRGEIWGIVGKNGSGKSTMLRAIAGIFSPDTGYVDIHGLSLSLQAVGVGFNRMLTGRENIMLSGMLLGFSEQEIMNRMEEIIEFSELGKFIDRPVRTYSSGMHSKLAFSINAILETDIMLIDEVLSVGDESFKRKSFAKMKDLISDKDRTVVIVSHSNSTLTELCDVVVWMHDGEIRQIGKPEEVVKNYQLYMKSIAKKKP